MHLEKPKTTNNLRRREYLILSLCGNKLHRHVRGAGIVITTSFTICMQGDKQKRILLLLVTCFRGNHLCIYICVSLIDETSPWDRAKIEHRRSHVYDKNLPLVHALF